MSVKIVDSLGEAIAHINKYNTSHSEAIITNNYDVAQRFLNEIDSACVYVNASTRFSAGNEFGLGAEIGISTQTVSYTHLFFNPREKQVVLSASPSMEMSLMMVCLLYTSTCAGAVFLRRGAGSGCTYRWL